MPNSVAFAAVTTLTANITADKKFFASAFILSFRETAFAVAFLGLPIESAVPVQARHEDTELEPMVHELVVNENMGFTHVVRRQQRLTTLDMSHLAVRIQRVHFVVHDLVFHDSMKNYTTILGSYRSFYTNPFESSSSS